MSFDPRAVLIFRDGDRTIVMKLLLEEIRWERDMRSAAWQRDSDRVTVEATSSEQVVYDGMPADFMPRPPSELAQPRRELPT